MKEGDTVYFLFTGWGLHDEPSWAIWQVRIKGDAGNDCNVTMIKKVGAYFFVFRKDKTHWARRKDLFKTTAEAKAALVRRLIEEQIAE